MANKYVTFITDEHLSKCIENLHQSYLRAKNKVSKKSFYANKVDTIKLAFDAKFNKLGEDELIRSEILRQIDKSTNNAIGTFHEQVLGGINGYEVGNRGGFDIRAADGSLFADIKNKHNTINSSSAEALFQKLARYADTYKQAKCYWVQILAKASFDEPWEAEINGREYGHSRVFKISGDRFYALLSGQENALFQLYKALPKAIDDYLESGAKDIPEREKPALEEILSGTESPGQSILDRITFENYGYYLGFDRL